MNNSATAEPAASPNDKARLRARRVDWYTRTIAVIGALISFYALLHMPADKTGLALFVLMAVIAELASVELFQSSQSQVSMSSVVAIASILALGPWAGVITYMASGVATAVTSALRYRGQHNEGAASLFQSTSFNVGMWTIAAAVAGSVYVLTGGIPGVVLRLPGIPPLIVTVIVEWLINAGLLVGVISLQSGQKPRVIWARDIRWQAPVSVAGGVVGGGFLALAYTTFGILGVLIVLLPVLSTSYAFRLYKNNMKDYVNGLENLNTELKAAMQNVELANQELTQANISIRNLNAELFQSLAKVFDMRDPYVGGHAAQVAVYAVAIATELGFPTERVELVRQAAYLHDIGKLAIPEAILNKTGRLTRIEYEFIMRHSNIGGDLLESTEGLKRLAPMVRHHHERWDGNGYPSGLKGEEIPLESRILNVCDSVETMASDRPYHRGKSASEILAEIRRCAGTQFDPLIAETFVNVLLRKNGNAVIVNSARSVTQQYAATILANQALAQNAFAWVLEREAQREPEEAAALPPTEQPTSVAATELSWDHSLFGKRVDSYRGDRLRNRTARPDSYP